MATTTATISADVSARTLSQGWGWLLALGIVQIVAGVFAIAVPILASFAAAIVFGAVLLVSAVFHLIHAFKVRKWPRSALYVLGGVLYGAGALLVFFFPLGGILTLTLLIATLLVGEGTLRILLANAVKPRAGWGWLLAAGIASVTLGVMLFTGWPAAAIWMIGLLLGVNLLFSGVTNCALAFTSRKAAQGLQAAPA
jgi:uncharacterized membrane protein HdeD (DUF308 family)